MALKGSEITKALDAGHVKLGMLSFVAIRPLKATTGHATYHVIRLQFATFVFANEYNRLFIKS